MEYSEIKLLTLELLGEIAEGSSTYSDDQISDGIQWAQLQTAQMLGLTYVEAISGTTGATAASGEIVMGVLIPTDAIKVKRLQVWDASMTDMIGE